MRNVISYKNVGHVYRPVNASLFNGVCIGELAQYVELPRPRPAAIEIEFSDQHRPDGFQFNSRGALIDINAYGGPFLYSGFQEELCRQWRKGNNYLRIWY